MFFRRGDSPEPPPKAFSSLGPAPGYTVKRFPDETSLDAYARANHVDANDGFTKRMFMGAVIPGKREVALLAPGVLRDPELEQQIAAHEYAHAWGIVHKDGKGWYTSDGKAWDSLSPDQQQAHIAAIQHPAAPAAYDWSQAFAAKPAADPLVQALQTKPAPTTPPKQPDPLLVALQQAKTRPG